VNRPDGECEQLAVREQSLREVADRVACAASNLHAVRAVLDAAGATLDHDLDAALDVLRAQREQLEHLAAELADWLRSQRAGRHHHGHRLGPPGTRRPLAVDASGAPATALALIADIAAELGPTKAAELDTRLGRATPAATAILTDLVDAGLTDHQLVHLLRGGHLLVPGHALLDRWRLLDGAKPRVSSHYHGAGQQFGVRGPFVHEVLFGPGPDDTTFVQLERAAPSAVHHARHLANWVEYRLTHENQGPYGASPFTDARPMRPPAPWRPDLPAGTAAAVRLAAARAELGRLGDELTVVADALATDAPLDVLVWRGPATDDFDDALRTVARSLAAVGVAFLDLGDRLAAGTAS
jgi:hypothetical protein